MLRVIAKINPQYAVNNIQQLHKAKVENRHKSAKLALFLNHPVGYFTD